MVSNEQILEHIAERKAVYEAHYDVMELRMIGQPALSSRLKVFQAMDKASIMTLEHVAHFIEHGEIHPDLIPQEEDAGQIEDKEEEPIVEEPAKPKGRGGRPRKPAAA